MVFALAVAFGVVILVIFVLVLGANSLIAKNQKRMAGAHTQIEARFGPGDYFVTLNPRRGFGMAWDREGIVFAEQGKEAELLPFDAVRDVGIDIDGVTVTESRNVTKTNRGSQLVGGAVGGALLGPAGLLVGGLSGSSTTTGKAIESRNVKSVKLTIRTNDRVRPLRSFSFYEATFGNGAPADSLSLAPTIAKAQHYHALITGLLEDRRAAGEATGTGMVA